MSISLDHQDEGINFEDILYGARIVCSIDDYESSAEQEEEESETITTTCMAGLNSETGTWECIEGYYGCGASDETARLPSSSTTATATATATATSRGEVTSTLSPGPFSAYAVINTREEPSSPVFKPTLEGIIIMCFIIAAIAGIFVFRARKDLDGLKQANKAVLSKGNPKNASLKKGAPGSRSSVAPKYFASAGLGSTKVPRSPAAINTVGARLPTSSSMKALPASFTDGRSALARKRQLKGQGVDGPRSPAKSPSSAWLNSNRK